MMKLDELKQIKDSLDKGVMIHKGKWLEVLDAAIKYEECLRQYADYGNWKVNDEGMFQVWNEPDSATPEAYHGYELARNAIFKG